MSGPGTAGGEPDVLGEARALLDAMRELAAGGAALFAAELRRAGLSLGLLLAAGVALAVLGAGTWLLVLAALAALAVASGAPLAATLAVFALANAAAVVACWMVMRALARNLGFVATRQMLSPPAEDRDAHAPEPA